MSDRPEHTSLNATLHDLEFDLMDGPFSAFSATALGLTLATGVALTGCDVDVDSGEMELPEVEVVDEGNLEMPEVEVDMPEVTTGTKTVEVEVPTVDVDVPEEGDTTVP